MGYASTRYVNLRFHLYNINNILYVYMLYSLYICYTLCIYVILSVYRGMSHSAMSDMQVITQETPDAPSTRSANSDRFFTASSTRDLDDWEFVGGTSST